MDIQNIIAGLIVLGALFYVGHTLRQKIGAFRPKKKSCGVGCGCDGKAESEI